MNDRPKIRLAFNSHGLGDCVHAAMAMRLYLRRGYDVRIQVEPNKRWIWEAAGIPIYDGAERLPQHPYPYPDGFWDLSTSDFMTSKIAHLFEVPELPQLGSKEEVWNLICAENFDATPFISLIAHAEAEQFLNGLPRPIFVLHSRGSNLADLKSIPHGVAFETILSLVEKTSGSVVVLDYDNRAPTVSNHPRVKNLKPDWGHISVERLCALLQRINLFIGIDSGPFHAASLVPSCKSLGVFRKIPPIRCCLPNANSTYLVPARDHHQWIAREGWNFAEYPGDEVGVPDIVDLALKLITPEESMGNQQLTEEQIAGFYLYHRVGRDRRSMELLPNGRIGIGSAGCERNWKIESTPSGQVLAIYGDRQIKTMELKLSPDGVFHGNWLVHEKMPIELSRAVRSADSPIEIERSTAHHKLENMSRFIAHAPPGIIIEVGVWKGGSLRYLATQYPDRTFIGFDTFEGMPAASELDNHHKAGDFGDTSFEDVRNALADLKNVTVIKGVFPASDITAESQIAMAHVDVDIFESTIRTFRHLSTKMAAGGRVYCDDAFQGTCEGATLALCQFAVEEKRIPRLDSGSHAVFQF